MLYRIKPIEDARWDEFLQRHERASVFHTPGWLQALKRTYGYEPIGITTCAPNSDLTDGAVFCRVESFLTGRRLVSLPFSDHCDLLADTPSALSTMLEVLKSELQQEKLRYVEIRPTHSLEVGNYRGQVASSYCLHRVDLRPSLEALFSDCHKDSTQRKVRRAKREGLVCRQGTSPELLTSFYHLLLLTRRRHSLPPQPKRWFESLVDCLGEALTIRVAFHEMRPVAAILTLRYKDILTYKYGCSDERFHHLGSMHALLWNAMEDAKKDGLRTFDLGRSDWSDTGLIAFKDRWGAKRSTLAYLRLSASTQHQTAKAYPREGWKRQVAKTVVNHLPDQVLRMVGNLMYKHIG